MKKKTKIILIVIASLFVIFLLIKVTFSSPSIKILTVQKGSDYPQIRSIVIEMKNNGLLPIYFHSATSYTLFKGSNLNNPVETATTLGDGKTFEVANSGESVKERISGYYQEDPWGNDFEVVINYCYSKNCKETRQKEFSVKDINNWQINTGFTPEWLNSLQEGV